MSHAVFSTSVSLFGYPSCFLGIFFLYSVIGNHGMGEGMVAFRSLMFTGSHGDMYSCFNGTQVVNIIRKEKMPWK
jgi:hypothetical protein